MANIEFSNINWKSTLWLNLLRSVSAGITWFIIRAFLQDGEAASMLLLPVVYLVILLPLGLLAIGLSRVGVPFVSLLSLMAAIAIVVGDPLLYLVSLFKPDIVPMKNFSPINFALILFVHY